MNAADTAHAFNDLVQELRASNRSIEDLAAEIASDYDGVNPAFLVRKFRETYPEGLPAVDVERAKRLQAEVDAKARKQEQAERAAILDFFGQHPSHLQNLGRPAARIVAGLVSAEVLNRLIQQALGQSAARYQTRDGEVVFGDCLSTLQSELVHLGLRGASRLDMDDIERAGTRVVTAQYIGGAHPTGKFIQIAVLNK